jgi:SAM-dependent methyltransferase
MDSAIRNLLYRRPSLYETIYPDPDARTTTMCRRLFARFSAAPPRSILDIGCGTARDLSELADAGVECWGVDYLPEMIAYAQRTRGHLRLQAGDMRSLRLGRAFDAILCLGSAVMYALTNADVARTFATFRAHAREGSLLVLDLNNASAYFGPGFRSTIETRVRSADFSADAVSVHSFDRRRQRMVRRRTWRLSDGNTVEDYCEYRLFFPAELETLLERSGFRVMGMYDNRDLAPSDLSGPRLYVAALKCDEIAS